jgi:hypothetical protein
VHFLAGAIACVVLPAYSYASGEGGLAWTMFSRSDSLRVSLRATDREGREHLLHPAQLGALTEPSLRDALRSADEFRNLHVGPLLRAELPRLALLACRIGSYASIDLTLEQKANVDAPVHPTRAHARCP